MRSEHSVNVAVIRQVALVVQTDDELICGLRPDFWR